MMETSRLEMSRAFSLDATIISLIGCALWSVGPLHSSKDSKGRYCREKKTDRALVHEDAEGTIKKNLEIFYLFTRTRKKYYSI